MRVAVLGILVSLSIAASTADEIHTKSLSWKAKHYFLRHGKDQEKETVISPGLLSEQGPDSSRALMKEGQRSKNERNGSSSGGSSDNSSPTLAKARKKEVDYHDLVRQFRKGVRKWRRKNRKKAEREGKKPKVEYYKDSGIFNVNIPLFSERNVLGYNLKNLKGLKTDLTRAGLFKVNRVVTQNDQHRWWYDVPMPPPQLAMPESSSPVAGDVNDFETNTVEENVDEGGKQDCVSGMLCSPPTFITKCVHHVMYSDLLKVSSDGKYAFTVYGGNIVVWNVAAGNATVTTKALPAIEWTGERPPPYPYPQPRPLPILLEPQQGEPVNAEQKDQEEQGGQNRRDLQLIAPFEPLYYCWAPLIPTIHSLMTYGNKLVVIASGYGESIRDKLDYQSVMYEAYSTKILLYDISTLDSSGTLELLKETDVHGSFDSIRAVENHMHMVTYSDLDTYTFIDEPLNRYLYFPDMDDEQYHEAARKLAEEKLIPQFVDRVVEDLFANGVSTDIARVSMMEENVSPDGKLEEQLFSQGILNHYAQVTSFDILQSDPSKKELTVTKTGAFTSSSWGRAYANEKMLVIATESWDWLSTVGASRQTTYLYGFSLLGNGEAVPAAVGTLEGTLLNEYSVDIVDGYMRVAVTIQNNLWRFPETAEDLEIPPTQNFVKVLKIPDLGGTDLRPILTEVGRTESLGKPREVITGVRFSEKVAFLVTFERTDPLYAVSFDDPENPKVLGELEITGFSRYLHFVDKDATLVLGVGQEATEDGRPIGLQVSLFKFDKNAPKKLEVIDQYPFELEDNVQSSSTAEFEFKAFRFVNLGEKQGILIIPLRVDAYYGVEEEGGEDDINFNGFILLDVSPEGIYERFRIPHSHPVYYRIGCYQSTDLPERSFVVKGDVTTLKGHSIHKYNLDSKELLDSINLDTFGY